MRRRNVILASVALVFVGGWFAAPGFKAWLLERPPSYESHFRDSVWIHFPPGYPYDDVDPLKSQVDGLLRSRKIGFWSGVMGSGYEAEIDFISLDLDFDLVDEVSLVKSFIDEGIIPMDVEIEYRPEKDEPEFESE